MASSKDWLREHFKDEYVKKAQAEGYVSRAAYKLLELNKRDQFLKPGMCVVDLGAAPGGWSQVAQRLLGEQGRLVALDILPMKISGMEFIQGDFREESVLKQLLEIIENQPVDLVMSDMAPNMSGNRHIDMPRSLYLNELAWDLTQTVLKPGGSLVCKVFQGEGSEDMVAMLKPHFTSLRWRKPKASRPRSNEVYVVAKGFKGNAL